MSVDDERRFARGSVLRRGCHAARTRAVLALLASWPLAATADPLTTINALRAQGCAAAPSATAAARRDSALDAAARELARGEKLGGALARVGYPVAKSTSFLVRGSRDDATIGRMLGERYCAEINNPRFTDLGFHLSGNNAWIVLAARTARPFTALQDPAAVETQVLELVNAARAKARECGDKMFAPAPPVGLSTALTAVASLHSLDMVEHDTLSHSGSDGSVVGDRILRAGYSWRISGENVASGQSDPESVVEAWLASPGHCATLMEPNFTDMGIAFALAPGRTPPIYWTQVFAAPR
jgi:uncharacterized protein YkwD